MNCVNVFKYVSNFIIVSTELYQCHNSVSVSKFEHQFRNPRERFGCAVVDRL